LWSGFVRISPSWEAELGSTARQKVDQLRRDFKNAVHRLSARYRGTRPEIRPLSAQPNRIELNF